MCLQPSMPIAPPITVPSVQNATVRTPLTVPAAASTPERSRSCSSSTLPSSKNVFRRSSGSRGSSDSAAVSGAMIVIETSCARRALAADGHSVLPEGERYVVPAKSKRIVDCVLVVALSRLPGDHVQIDLRIEVAKVQRGRDDSVPQRHHGQDGLHRSDCSDGVAECRL